MTGESKLDQKLFSSLFLLHSNGNGSQIRKHFQFNVFQWSTVKFIPFIDFVSSIVTLSLHIIYINRINYISIESIQWFCHLFLDRGVLVCLVFYRIYWQFNASGSIDNSANLSFGRAISNVIHRKIPIKLTEAVRPFHSFRPKGRIHTKNMWARKFIRIHFDND